MSELSLSNFNIAMACLFIASCGYIHLRIDPLINRVCWGKTPIKILIPFSVIIICLLSSSAAGFVYAISGYQPPWYVSIFVFSVALVIHFDRRGIISKRCQLN